MNRLRSALIAGIMALVIACARLRGEPDFDPCLGHPPHPMVHLEAFPHVRGVLIPAEEAAQFRYQGTNDTYTLSLTDVGVAEQVLHNLSPLMARQWAIDRARLDDRIRQYVGFRDSTGRRKVLVNLFDISSREARKTFRGWQCAIMVGGGDPWEKYAGGVIIDLDRRIIEPYREYPN